MHKKGRGPKVETSGNQAVMEAYVSRAQVTLEQHQAKYPNPFAHRRFQEFLGLFNRKNRVEKLLERYKY